MEQAPDTQTSQASLPVAGTEDSTVNTALGVGQGELTSTDNLEAKQYKTLGIRVDNELHAKLSFITQLRDSTLQGEILEAIRSRVEAAQQDPDLIAKAAEVRAQIEAEARARQAAIAGMFGATAVAGAVEQTVKPSSRRSTRRGD
jgi:hypothetical protein